LSCCFRGDNLVIKGGPSPGLVTHKDGGGNNYTWGNISDMPDDTSRLFDATD
jgi:hypothetical protein